MQIKLSQQIERILKQLKLEDFSTFVVAVSGGADSLALALLMKNWADANKKHMVALTVDHGLRPSSAKEAKYVAQVMKQYEVEHYILEWKGKKPATNVEEKAREARYGLIEKWCLQNKVKFVFVAHHMQDQAETFLIRLQRGSGVDGLSAMNVLTKRNDIFIVRPMLNCLPEDLKVFLQIKHINWVEDETNLSDAFLRGRVRKLLPLLDEKLGIDVQKLADTAQRMGRVRTFLEEVTQKFIKNNVRIYNKKIMCFTLKNFAELHEEIAFRVLSKLLTDVAEKVYPPRFERLENLYKNMLKSGFKSQTLQGCEVILSAGKIWIVPEMKNMKICKKEWEEFLETKPKLKTKKIPSKARIALIKL